MSPRRRRRGLLPGSLILVLIGVFAALAVPASAQGQAQKAPRGIEVDAELLLMVDVSGSVDQEEAQLQRNGYVDALKDPTVVRAIQAGPLGRVAVAYVEWADQSFQQTILDWIVIDGQASANEAARRLAAAPLTTQFWTAIGAAITRGVAMIEGNAYQGTRRIIDISGDGYSNRGVTPGQARDAAARLGITINGLPIMGRQRPGGAQPPADLDQYYAKHVIGGPGAFVQAAQDFQSFDQAILTKLVDEIADLRRVPGEAPPAGRFAAQ